MTASFKYTVLSGDSFYSIATGINAASGVTYQAILQANNGLSPSALQVGQVLNIPASDGSGTALRYTVLPGDTLSGIADAINANAGVTYQQIEQANPGITPSSLAPGQVLTIGGSSGGSTQEKVDAENIGYWDKTWAASGAPPSATMGLAFSGYADPALALQQSQKVYNQLVGDKYLTLGGSNGTTPVENDPGYISKIVLTKILNAINAGSFSAYQGIAYDVELGESGMADLFSQVFAASKAKGFKVLVTVSHSAPYSVGDAAQLMDSFFADANIDILSPQLYASGTETANDFATTWGVATTWQQYATAKAATIPSIVTASLYPAAKQYFAQMGITCKGYIQWAAAS